MSILWQVRKILFFFSPDNSSCNHVLHFGFKTSASQGADFTLSSLPGGLTESSIP